MEDLRQLKKKLFCYLRYFGPLVGNGRQYLLVQQVQLLAVYVYEVY